MVQTSSREQYIRVRIKPLDIPPVKDGLVIGNRAAIGTDALQRTLQLVSSEKFESITFSNDDVVSHVLIRAAVLKKLSRAKLTDFVLKRLKPLMTEAEILMLDIDVEVVVEDKL